MLTVSDALKQRISVRKFRATPVSRQLLEEVLDAARWSPSGGNLQPWKVIAITGAERAAVMALARAAQAAGKPGHLAQVARNFEFFGTPVGLFFVIDRRMGRAQWAHLGMFMQSLALVAVERGLGTCMQEFWGTLRDSLHHHFALPETDVVYCGMALGFADLAAPVHQLRSERAAVEKFCTLRGF